LAVFISQRLGMSETTIALWLYLALASVVVAAAIWGVPELVAQGETVVEELPTWLEHTRQSMQTSSSRVLRMASHWIPTELPNLSEMDSTDAEGNGALMVTQVVLQVVLGAIVIGMLAFYWTINEELTIRSILHFAPDHKRQSSQDLIERLLRKLGAYIRGQAILCAIVFVFSLIAYSLIGLPYVLSLALVAGLLEAIPIFGPTLGAIPAIIVGLNVGPKTAALVLAATILIQLLENYVFVPKVMDKSVGIGAVVVLLSIVAFGALLGPLGAILAIPLAAIVQTLFEDLVLQRDFKEQEFSAPRDFTGVVRYQLQDLIHDLQRQQRQKTSPSDEFSAAAFDEMERLASALDKLVECNTDDDDAEASLELVEPR
jgi:predicted PurR-regulated permease PerM